MALTICHTADWHLGHTLYRRGREREHAAFLAWLLDELEARAADALIVAGDVFESGNPPGSALAMFYAFLADARRRLPGLAIVIVAGNHDSPARLAAPDPVLRGQGVAVIGSVPYEGERIAVERLVIPIVRAAEIVARVVAVPFLRSADLPAVDAAWGADPHARGSRRVYDEAIAHARAVRESEPILVTGHFAAAGARMSRDSERMLIGGLDGTLPPDVIDTRDVAYVALGHLHLAQRVRASMSDVEMRYAGSPIPLAFSERAFEHEVRFVTIEHGVTRSEGVRVPRSVELLRLPESGVGSREEILAALAMFPPRAGSADASTYPWVEVRARVGGGDRDAVEAIEGAAEDRAVHLARVVLERPEVESALPAEDSGATSLDVRDVLVARWVREHGEPPSEGVLAAFDEAVLAARARLEQRRSRNVELEGERAWVVGAAIAARTTGAS